jgi:uncharacterized protein YcbK (DUF882 family)
VTKLSSDNGPSEHLSWDELACKDGTPYPKEFRNERTAGRLAALFENIRFASGEKPIEILSAYRTKSHNNKIGGARFSQHLYGRALDLRPPKGMKLDKFYDIIHSNAFRFDIGGIGRYKTFVHVDIRTTSKLIVWSGTGLKDSRTA